MPAVLAIHSPAQPNRQTASHMTVAQECHATTRLLRLLCSPPLRLEMRERTREVDYTEQQLDSRWERRVYSDVDGSV